MNSFSDDDFQYTYVGFDLYKKYSFHDGSFTKRFKLEIIDKPSMIPTLKYFTALIAYHVCQVLPTFTKPVVDLDHLKFFMDGEVKENIYELSFVDFRLE